MSYSDPVKSIESLYPRVINDDDGLYKMPGGYLCEGKSQAVVKLGRHVVYQVPPNPAIATATLTGQRILFRVVPGLTERNDIENMFLDLTFLETGGANSATMVPLPMTIQQIDFCFNGSTTSQQVVTGDELYAFFQYYRPNELQSLAFANQLGMSPTTFLPTTTIAKSSSQLFSIPLPMSFFNRLNPSTLTGDLIMIVTMQNANPVTAGSAGGVLSLSNANLRLLCTQDRKVSESVIDRVSRSPYYFSYCQCNLYNQATTITASVQQDIQLAAIIGKIGGLIVMIRASVALPQNLTAFQQLGGLSDAAEFNGLLDVVTASKVSLTGSGNLYPSWYRGQSLATHTFGLQSSAPNIAIYHITFAEDIQNFAMNGVVTGCIDSDGTTYLRLQPGAAFPSGSFQLTVLGLTAASAVQDRGILYRRF